jgi:hypothetical protein
MSVSGSMGLMAAERLRSVLKTIRRRVRAGFGDAESDQARLRDCSLAVNVADILDVRAGAMAA